ncbi:MAG: DUF932 domain-containing protein [Ignavibacteria bacterium]|nr:DUF932 domain-containing protein [Ignavibacteria bacterium]
MNSITLQDLSFQLVKRPVYTFLENGTKILIPGKTALINPETGLPISVVSKSYEIITNSEALYYGKTCMKTLFDIKNDSDIELFNIISPVRLSFCHIDLISRQNRFDVFEDEYLPFIRITNSYNTSFKLSFKIGVCRSICKNGMIFDEEAIWFKYDHVKGAKRKINFEVKKDEFTKFINDFKSDVQILKESDLKYVYSFLIFCKALGLKFVINNSDPIKKNKSKEKLLTYQKIFHAVLSKYIKELGDNYYSLYNTITELSTFGFVGEPFPVLSINSRQKRAGYWVKSFSSLLSNVNIDYDEYLNLSKN